MSALVNSLLEFSTIDNRQIEIAPINTAQLLDDVINNLYSIIELKNAEICISENIPKIIRGDETLLKIVFQNLINNALKFIKVDKIPRININYKNIDLQLVKRLCYCIMETLVLILPLIKARLLY